jgi:hypothetical protein
VRDLLREQRTLDTSLHPGGRFEEPPVYLHCHWQQPGKNLSSAFIARPTFAWRAQHAPTPNGDVVYEWSAGFIPAFAFVPPTFPICAGSIKMLFRPGTAKQNICDHWAQRKEILTG